MRINLNPHSLWREKNEALAESLGVDLETHELRIYPNVETAINESMVGLRRLYPLKKKFFYIKHQIPQLETPLRTLAKEGLQVDGLGPEVLTNPDLVTNKIDRETNFFFYAVDDSVLATLFDIKALEAALAPTPLYRIRISFHRHLIDGFEPVDRNVVQIYATPDDQAIAILGEKVKYPLQGVELLDWHDLDVDQLAGALRGRTDDEKKVKAFESLSDLGFKPLLSPGTQRFFDRALVTWPDLDATAMFDLLRGASRPQQVVPLGLSYWGSVRGSEWLYQKGFSKETLRGSMIVPAQIIDDGLIKSINEGRRKILEAQNGD